MFGDMSPIIGRVLDNATIKTSIYNFTIPIGSHNQLRTTNKIPNEIEKEQKVGSYCIIYVKKK